MMLSTLTPSRDATTGFTINNTNTEKVSMVPRHGTTITTKMVSVLFPLLQSLKNGTKVDSKTSYPDVSGAWTYSFSGL